jgi:hypothetical protein
MLLVNYLTTLVDLLLGQFFIHFFKIIVHLVNIIIIKCHDKHQKSDRLKLTQKKLRVSLSNLVIPKPLVVENK